MLFLFGRIAQFSAVHGTGILYTNDRFQLGVLSIAMKLDLAMNLSSLSHLHT